MGRLVAANQLCEEHVHLEHDFLVEFQDSGL